MIYPSPIAKVKKRGSQDLTLGPPASARWVPLPIPFLHTEVLRTASVADSIALFYPHQLCDLGKLLSFPLSQFPHLENNHHNNVIYLERLL